MYIYRIPLGRLQFFWGIFLFCCCACCTEVDNGRGCSACDSWRRGVYAGLQLTSSCDNRLRFHRPSCKIILTCIETPLVFKSRGPRSSVGPDQPAIELRGASRSLAARRPSTYERALILLDRLLRGFPGPIQAKPTRYRGVTGEGRVTDRAGRWYKQAARYVTSRPVQMAGQAPSGRRRPCARKLRRLFASDASRKPEDAL